MENPTSGSNRCVVYIYPVISGGIRAATLTIQHCEHSKVCCCNEQIGCWSCQFHAPLGTGYILAIPATSKPLYLQTNKQYVGIGLWGTCNTN